MKLCAIATIAFVCCILCENAVGDELAIVQDGTAHAAVIVPASPTEYELLAQKELLDYIRRMTGANLTVGQPRSGQVTIYIGRASALPAPIEPPDNDDGYVVEAGTTDLWLLGKTDRGALFAVYDLLDTWGCRWYMPGELGEVVPQRKTLAVPLARHVETPDFMYRQIWYSWGGPPGGGERLNQWSLRNRLAHPRINHGHNLTATLPPDKYLTDHPEYYSLINGKRQPKQLCTSNPEVIKLVIEAVNRYFDANPDVLSYSLCPDDNTQFCECDSCKALDVGGTDPYTRKTLVTDRYTYFLNQVAQGIQERHPGKMVSTYAYVNYSTPPIRETISPHVAVFFTTSVYCSAHGIGDPQCKSRMEMKEHLAGWARACPNVFIYEYDPVPGNAEVPWPLFGARAKEMPVYRELGIKGFSFETHCSWATISPNFWVAARTMWDADLTDDKLLEDYCRGFFEESAEPMRQFYVALEGQFRRWTDKVGWGQRDIPDLFPLETVKECRAALNRALEIATEPITKKRLELIDMGFRYFESYFACRRIEREGGDWAEFDREYKQCWSLMKQLNEMYPDAILEISATQGFEEGFGSIAARRFGKELGFVTDWMVIGPFDNANMAGHSAVYPPEKQVNLEASYPGKSGKVRWRKYHSHGGYVDLTDTFKPKDWVTAYAYAVIESREDMASQIRCGSNDSLKVWVGGKLAYEYPGERVAQSDEDVVPVKIAKGRTPVLLKISQTEANWGFYFRLTDTNGNPIAPSKAKFLLK